MAFMILSGRVASSFIHVFICAFERLHRNVAGMSDAFVL